MLMFVLISGGHHQRLNTGPGSSTIYSQTGCEGGLVRLNCDGGQSIRILRAVWGRYSQAICPDDSQHEDRSQEGVTMMCGDRRHSRRIIAAECQGKEQCELRATSEVFGDPCPGVREFLEVQYQCQEVTQRPGPGQRRPGLSGDIALVWGAASGQRLDTVLRERLTMSRPVTSRIPITAAPMEADEAGDLRHPELLDIGHPSALSSDLTWLVVLALVILTVLLSLVIIKARDLSTKHRGHSFPQAPESKHAPCLMAGQANITGEARLVFCRPDLSTSRQFKDLSASRQFTSEPSLGRHSCVVLNSSDSWK